jgi:hypothetical protein
LQIANFIIKISVRCVPIFLMPVLSVTCISSVILPAVIHVTVLRDVFPETAGSYYLCVSLTEADR